MKTFHSSLIALVTITALGASSAQAGGFLGDLINVVAPGVGTQLDQWNHNLGYPTEHVTAGIVDSFVPGAGNALRTGWAMQYSGMLNRPPQMTAPNFSSYPNSYGGYAQPNYGYNDYGYNNFGYNNYGYNPGYIGYSQPYYW